MAQLFHVNGEAQIKTTAGGATNTVLGVTVPMGVHIRIRHHNKPVYRDTEGREHEADAIQLLQTAIITAQLIFYDDAQLDYVRAPLAGGTGGTMAAAGTLIGAGSKYYRVLVLSPIDSHPWNFPTCRALDAQEASFGIEESVWNVTWLAVAYSASTGSTANRVLWNTTTT